MNDYVQAWQCIGCGKIEAPQTCIGVCQDRKVQFVYAFEHEEVLAQVRRAQRHASVLEAVVRQLACTTPHKDGWERSFRALQDHAKRALLVLATDILDEGAAVSVVVYGVTMALIGLMFDVLFLYAMRRGLLAIELTPESRPRGAWVYQAGPLVYLIGSALAAVSPVISLVIFAALAAFWAIVEVAPRRL